MPCKAARGFTAGQGPGSAFRVLAKTTAGPDFRAQRNLSGVDGGPASAGRQRSAEKRKQRTSSRLALAGLLQRYRAGIRRTVAVRGGEVAQGGQQNSRDQETMTEAII